MLTKPSFVFNNVFIHVFYRFSSFSNSSAFARYGNAKLTIDHETLIYLVPFYKATAFKTIQQLLSHRLFSTTRVFCGGTKRQKGQKYETSMMVLRDIFCLTMMALRDSLSSDLIYSIIGHYSLNCAIELLNAKLHTKLNIFIKCTSNFEHTSVSLCK